MFTFKNFRNVYFHGKQYSAFEVRAFFIFLGQQLQFVTNPTGSFIGWIMGVGAILKHNISAIYPSFSNCHIIDYIYVINFHLPNSNPIL